MQQNFPFHVVGVSHHTASVETRERFAVGPAEAVTLLDRFRRASRSALLLSTCNRFELYWWGEDDGRRWFQDLVLSRGVTSLPELTQHLGLEAMRHLLRVSAGLDSQILGETEILGQVRRAYDAARAAGTTTPEMDLILSAALFAGRRVRRETVLGRHPGSVSSAAVSQALEQMPGFQAPEVLVLGAGEAAEGVLRALHEHGCSRVTLVSRHPQKGRVLAGAWGAAAAGWDELEQRLEGADLLLVATASTRPVVRAAQLRQAAIARRRDLLVVDLAVPRNVEPASRDVPGVQLLDLDDLQRLCCPAAGAASAELSQAERIIEEELVRLGQSLRGRVAAPRLAELHRLGQEIAEQESAWALAHLATLSDSEREVVREMAERLVRRVLYPVSRSLRHVEAPTADETRHPVSQG